MSHQSHQTTPNHSVMNTPPPHQSTVQHTPPSLPSHMPRSPFQMPPNVVVNAQPYDAFQYQSIDPQYRPQQYGHHPQQLGPQPYHPQHHQQQQQFFMQQQQQQPAHYPQHHPQQPAPHHLQQHAPGHPQAAPQTRHPMQYQQPQGMMPQPTMPDMMQPNSSRAFPTQQFSQPAPPFMNRPMAPTQAAQSLQLPITSTPMSSPLTIPTQQPQSLSQSSSPVMTPQNAMKTAQSPMNGDTSPMTDGSSIMASTPPSISVATTPASVSAAASATSATSPVLSPTNGGTKKPKNLRVQIPMDAKENSTLAGAIKEEESSELPPIQKRPLESAPISSTLPSQFAKNLPSPSTFYPEFYASQAELSPIVFGQTPTSAQPGSAFHWPAPRERELSRVHQPSPLAKGQNASVTTTTTTSSSSSTEGGSSLSTTTTTKTVGSSLRITLTNNDESTTPEDTTQSNGGENLSAPTNRSRSRSPNNTEEGKESGADGPLAKKVKKN
ncbi:hypothetical protein BGW38_000598 [Lunasporangiospora selenospora]|uniref:Uncharacterized protein n=1 Tax=Lunasporangiospora selenospora TaxID=979761 RepID=A0A9P6FV25_9FUNG|nr:hypothetical protein BGW38_000598 [Lunasporangiospora selenospora]